MPCGPWSGVQAFSTAAAPQASSSSSASPSNVSATAPSGTSLPAGQYGTGTSSDPINLGQLYTAANSGNTAAQQEISNLIGDGTISAGGAPVDTFGGSSGQPNDQGAGPVGGAYGGAVRRVGAVRPAGRLILTPSGNWVLA